MRQGQLTTRTSPPPPARGIALAAMLALLAMLGTASGVWSVAHHLLDHAQHHTPAAPCHDGEVSPPQPQTPAPDHTPGSDHDHNAPSPTEHDCPTCDLIAGSQVITLTHATSLTCHAQPTVLSRLCALDHPVRQHDLSVWAARPPPHHG